MINTAALLLTLALAPPIKADAAIGIPSRLPPYSKVLPKGMLGLSIELDRWPSWSGDEIGSPNNYFNQVLSNLASRTGQAVPIRVGANSEDRAHLQLDAPVSNVTFPPPTDALPYPEATSIGIGEQFYALSANLPNGTPMTWGVNLNYLNETETVAQASLIFDTFYGSRKNITSHLKLELMEIGNEPDHYSSPIFNTYIPGWDNFDYISAWKRFAGAVAASVPINFEGGPRFQFGSAAQIQQGYIWTPSGLLGTDLLDSPEAKLIGTYSEHSYQGANTGNATTNPKAGSLLDKVAIRNALSILGKNAGVAKDAGIKYVLGEANSYARHGIHGISDAAEAALWLVDYTLGAATVGIERIFFHEGIGYAYNLIQPIPVTGDGPNTSGQPTVQAGYYGALMVNEAIGTHERTKIVELATNSSMIGSYGIYEDERLARVIAINYDKFYPDQNSTRLAQTVVFPDSWKGRTVSVKRFTTPATNATAGLLWAGQAFESPDGVPSGQVVEEWLNGTSVIIQAAEAALFCLKD